MSTAPSDTPGAHRAVLPAGGRGRLVLVSAGSVLAVLLVAVATLLIVQRGEALPGTTLGDRDVGGLGRSALVAVSGELATERSAKDIRVVAGNRESAIAAADVRLTLDAEDSAERALNAGRSNFLAGIWNGVAARFGKTNHVEPTAVLDEVALDAEVERIQSEVDRRPRRGGFTVETNGTSAQAQNRAPRTGQELQVEAATVLLREALTSGADRVELDVEVTDPGVTSAQAEAVTRQANAALGQPLVLSDDDDRELRLSPSDLAPLLGAERDPVSGLRLVLDEEAAAATVKQLASPLESTPTSADLTSPRPAVLLTDKGNTSFRAQRISTSASGGSAGLAVDVEATVAALNEAVLAGEPTAELATEVLPAPVSADELAKVNQVIGSFTTSYSCCAPRARNIARMAELVDGTVVAPGDTFSLNETAGERTKARGFFEDGAILQGELVQQVGGGVSQFSTTLFNAVWFAGLPSLQHQPHSAYISRYPPGREATLNWGSIDNVFRNDTAHPVVVRATTTSTSVTVALYGRVGKRVVESVTGPRQQRSNGGFRVVVDRTVRDRGDVVREDQVSWTYGPPL